MSSPAAVRSGRAGLVVVLSPTAVRIACAERGWSLSELARRAWPDPPWLDREACIAPTDNSRLGDISAKVINS